MTSRGAGFPYPRGASFRLAKSLFVPLVRNGYAIRAFFAWPLTGRMPSWRGRPSEARVPRSGRFHPGPCRLSFVGRPDRRAMVMRGPGWNLRRWRASLLAPLNDSGARSGPSTNDNDRAGKMCVMHSPERRGGRGERSGSATHETESPPEPPRPRSPPLLGREAPGRAPAAPPAPARSPRW